MKKLELKHLAAYMPYGVTAFKRNIFPPNEYKLTVMKGSMILMLSHDEKIVLRPLSDLTKEITHNGETFVPIKELELIFSEGYNDFEFSKEPFRLGFRNLMMGTSSLVSYDVFAKLHEWHFDTFNLGENNLCVYMNPDGSLK